MSHEKRAADRKRRMAELMAEAEEQRAEARASMEAAATVEGGPGSWLIEVAFVVILMVISAALFGTAVTISRFTGADIADARRTGEATVEQCERDGPIGLSGFGYVKACAVSIRWNGGGGERVMIGKPGFFTDEKPGDTFTIGENTGSRGSVGYSRAEVPPRRWVTALVTLISIIGVAPLLFAIGFVRYRLRRR
ncbi:hypothetical protein ACWT_0531 [Actinoplanes sp. SE50]|uniref:DUF6346 domain-containing protein n=1 Tax=unclassified Actinoplanes TaxID=2626549 RepID=UPI00023ECBFF|nr:MULTISPECIES: DUF6346 domain-containing protein [unclassified Actinoplanes]AEV81544.1 hypothetical protein ACPL_647 [Actinoplanes sp. SE50/110]ATO79946.1 hypothetical protein ACWT_0531 [Actinoplanes sp. SE50]SLL97348.1 hypothetical protein ACSP50_0549 [Actinoplanes sp. SE50/110]